ncbi:hypothetical protein TNCV_4774001 [Trichonephila clavipes]|nr:hypothetical protein TNCV_4774001 [Trichonephila clavipes]
MYASPEKLGCNYAFRTMPVPLASVRVRGQCPLPASIAFQTHPHAARRAGPRLKRRRNTTLASLGHYRHQASLRCSVKESYMKGSPSSQSVLLQTSLHCPYEYLLCSKQIPFLTQVP